MTSLHTLLERIEARAKAATPGPWLFGDWDIYEEDREAQKLGKPYWTLVSNGYRVSGLIKGPHGRKSHDVEYIIQGSGYECDGLDVKEADAEFIAHARQDIPKLLRVIELAVEALEFECGNRCAIGINPCNARETLEENQ